MPRDYHSRIPKGFAFVEFVDYLCAKDAMRGLDGGRVDGSVVSVVFAQHSRKSRDEMKGRGRRGRDESWRRGGGTGGERWGDDERWRGDSRIDRNDAERGRGGDTAGSMGEKAMDDGNDGGHHTPDGAGDRRAGGDGGGGQASGGEEGGGRADVKNAGEGGGETAGGGGDAGVGL